MTISIDNLRRIAGMDSDVVPDDEAQEWLNAATDWYADAGVTEEAHSGSSFGFWVVSLAAWMYDHRAGGDTVPQVYVLSVHSLRPSRGDVNG